MKLNFVKKSALNLEVIIEYGLYFLVFVLPWQARWIIRGGEINNGYSEYSTISLYGTDVLLIIVLALFAVYKIINFSRKSGERLKIQPVWLLVAGLELMVFISIFASADKLMAIYAYGRFLLGVGLFWLIMSASYNRIKLIYAFLGGVFLQTCLGVWQFLIQSSRACKWLGLSVHNPADAGVSVVETLSGERWLRAYGGLDHPNMLGGLLAISLLLALYIFLFKIHHKQYNSKFLINAKYLILNIVVLFFLVGLFFTFSRGAWVGLIAGILSILIIALIKRDLLAQKKILKIILAGGILVFILFNLYGDLVMTRLAKDARLELKSNAERIESFAGARDVIADNWALGAGIGNYAKYNANMANSNYANDKDNFLPAWEYQPVHNVFLLVWSEIGIFGLAFFIGLFLFGAYYALRRRTETKDKTEIYKFGLLMAMVVMFMVDHWWWSLHFGVIFFWLILGFLFQEKNKIK